MAKVLTENHELLGAYLAAVGCEKAAVILMIAELWDENATIEMLEFCRDNPDASQMRLLEMSSKIASKYEK